MELAAGSDVRMTAPAQKAILVTGQTTVATIQLPQTDRLPMPGAVIIRQYKGETIEVKVLPKGFEYEGEIYRSLSAVARKVTGTHWNGYHFFQLGRKGNNDHGRQEG
jgi:hypothetical protein